MLELISEKQVTLIVDNIVKACKDINKLNKTGYNFIYLASGFITHYDICGFIDHYSFYSLKTDILEFKIQNQWNNFHPGEKDYEYYMQKKKIYNMICEKI